MHRTQIYLTDEQRARVARHAHDAGVSQAEVIRRILDRDLGIDDGVQARLAAVTATAGVLPNAPGWEEWLAKVRGRGADARLTDLGFEA